LYAVVYIAVVQPKIGKQLLSFMSYCWQQVLEVLSEEEEEEEENSFDHNDELSVSLPSADGVTQEGDGDEVSKAKKGKTREKASRLKRADCWKYFKVISVQSKKQLGVKITKAKCKFCTKSYVYHKGGSYITTKSTSRQVHTIFEQVG